MFWQWTTCDSHDSHIHVIYSHIHDSHIPGIHVTLCMCIYDVLKKCSRESVCTPSVYSITTPLHYLSIFSSVLMWQKRIRKFWPNWKDEKSPVLKDP